MGRGPTRRAWQQNFVACVGDACRARNSHSAIPKPIWENSMARKNTDGVDIGRLIVDTFVAFCAGYAAGMQMSSGSQIVGLIMGAIAAAGTVYNFFFPRERPVTP